LSLSQLVLVFAEMGSQDLIAREVSRNRDSVHDLFYNFLMMRNLVLVVLWMGVCGVVAISGYSFDEQVAIALIAAGTAVGLQTNTYFAVFQAHERNEFIASTLVLQRGVTACVGIAVLLLGGGLIISAAIYCVGTLGGQLAAYFFLHRKVIKPRRQINLDRWMPLIRASVPLGLVSLAYFALIRLDATLLGFLKGGGGNSSEVGIYGAAYRLVDATMFISWSFGGAMVPWLARHREGSGSMTLARGYELGLKALTAMLLPIGTAYLVLAGPLINTLYGPSYADAAAPLRWLGGMTVLYGINSFVAVLVVQRKHPGDFARPVAFVIAQNLIFNLILIPRYGATGAAFNAVFSGLLLAIWTSRRAVRRIGHVNFFRVFAAPLLASAAMAGAIHLAGASLGVLPIAAGAVAYGTTFILVERFVFPRDFEFYLSALQVRRRLLRIAPG
jgi:O-antigen/teichoic acid export membrane protein